jgi:hypothetical protein
LGNSTDAFLLRLTDASGGVAFVPLMGGAPRRESPLVHDWLWSDRLGRKAIIGPVAGVPSSCFALSSRCRSCCSFLVRITLDLPRAPKAPSPSGAGVGAWHGVQ